MKRLCAHLHGFHLYAADPTRAVEANHYCAHLNDGQSLPFLSQSTYLRTGLTSSDSPEVRQCLIYDSPEANARLIGVEYLITAKLYDGLDSAERKLWHSHVFEVKSGMAIMPPLVGVPIAAWELAENKEMEQIISLYGKTYHFWQVDRGDKLPLGEPQLMMAFTEEVRSSNWKEMLKDRDERFHVDSQAKSDARKYIKEPKIHPGTLVQN